MSRGLESDGSVGGGVVTQAQERPRTGSGGVGRVSRGLESAGTVGEGGVTQVWERPRAGASTEGQRSGWVGRGVATTGGGRAGRGGVVCGRRSSSDPIRTKREGVAVTLGARRGGVAVFSKGKNKFSLFVQIGAVR